MFDVWRRIDEKGAVAVPTGGASLSALGWAELGERYPELMPERFRGYDAYSDPQLIRESPFAPVVIDGAKSFHFKATDPIGGKSFDAWDGARLSRRNEARARPRPLTRSWNC